MDDTEMNALPDIHSVDEENVGEKGKERVEQNVSFFDNVNFSRIGFVFLIFVIVSSGYVSEILSCQMRYVFETNPYFRHFIGILMFFVFIMCEGGWSFNKEEDEKSSNSWSSGNVIHTAMFAFGLYCIFLISSKSRFIYNILFFALILIVYLVNTQRSYYYVRESISDDTNTKLLLFENFTTIVAFIVLIFGFGDYFVYQLKNYGENFSLSQFILGAHKCKSVRSLNNASTNISNGQSFKILSTNFSPGARKLK